MGEERSEERTEIELAIRTAFDARDYERAATLTIEQYGHELFGFLHGQMRNADDASDAFAQFSEVFWKTLPDFEWRCSARTWAYKLARRAASHYRRREHKHVAAAEPLTQLSIAVERVRTATVAYRRTAVKDRFQELRAQLSDEDQTLLILRVDRGLSWLELAEIMLGDGEATDEAALKTEAARLRKRFQIAKDRLKALAQEAGLLDS